MAVPAADLVATFRTWLGTYYKFGGEQDDCAPRNVDCSEGVEWACRCAGVSPTMPDGSWAQFDHCDNHGLRITFEEARNTIGALLFKSYTDAYPPGDRNNSGIYHVAMVSGPDTTMEICCDDGDRIVERKISGRSWYIYGGRIPGVAYTTEAVPEPPTTDVPVVLPIDTGGAVTVRQLAKGASGRDVRQMQAMLSEWAISPGAHDGQFGSGTDSAVRTFQGARGLAQDGIVGERTWSSLLGY